MGEIVESPVLKERFAIGDNTPTVDAYCPIDGTQLVSVREYDFSNYSCAACGATYRWGDKDPASLREQAIRYASRVKEEVGDRSRELAKLEEIIQAAQQSGLTQN